jgi:hypothetical protein
MKDLIMVLIATKDDADLHRYGAVVAIVGNYFGSYIFGRYQLSHQSIIINVQIIDQSEDLKILRWMHDDHPTELWQFQRCHPATCDTTTGAGTQKKSNLIGVHLRYLVFPLKSL